jgi:hypothetical protein
MASASRSPDRRVAPPTAKSVAQASVGSALAFRAGFVNSKCAIAGELRPVESVTFLTAGHGLEALRVGVGDTESPEGFRRVSAETFLEPDDELADLRQRGGLESLRREGSPYSAR